MISFSFLPFSLIASFCQRRLYLAIADQSEASNNLVYEILFDEEFLGGLTIRSSPNRAYRLPCSSLLNLSFGKRLHDSEQEERNATPQRNVHTGLNYASALGASTGQTQESHYTNYAEDYLSNPRLERGRFAGRGRGDQSSSVGRGRGHAHLTPQNSQERLVK